MKLLLDAESTHTEDIERFNQRLVCLERVLIDEMNGMGITILEQEAILFREVLSFLRAKKYNQTNHVLKFALLGVRIANYLGFSNHAKIIKFHSDIAHDRGKQELLHLVDRTDLSLEEKEEMKTHVSPARIPTNYGEVVSSAIEQHHRHQTGRLTLGPYPEKLHFQETSESRLLSQLIAAQDFYLTCLYKGNGNKEPVSASEAVNKTKLEYGQMRIFYEGKMFPYINTNGENLIKELVQARLI